MQNSIKHYQIISISKIEQAFTEHLYKELPGFDDDEVVDFSAIKRTSEQVEDIVANPASDYNKILDGYPYKIYLDSVILTGAGGARHMYKAMLLEGMSQEQICSVIYVLIGESEYSLNLLKISETNG